MKLPSFTMERLRNIALSMIAVLNAIATVTSFSESYYGNFRWAEQHEITGIMGGIWPLMIDLIILVVEAGLFVAHYDKWKLRHKAWLWSVMVVTLGVSVGANTGHFHSSDWLTHLTGALAPIALMFTTTVGFGVMKRTFANKPPARAAELRERSHVGTAAWIESPALAASHTTVSESPSHVSLIETPEAENAPVIEPAPESPADARLSETLVGLGFKATDKSFTMPRDPRTEITLPEKRVRDMYDVDPDISVNAIAQALGIAWATANKYLKATKEARGLTV